MAKTTTFSNVVDSSADTAANWDNGLPVAGDTALCASFQEMNAGTITADSFQVGANADISMGQVTLHVNRLITIDTTYYGVGALAVGSQVKAGIKNGPYVGTLINGAIVWGGLGQ